MSETPKVHVGNTVAEAATALRNMAILTADNTRNWDNYEQICLQILEQVFEAGKKAAAPDAG